MPRLASEGEKVSPRSRQEDEEAGVIYILREECNLLIQQKLARQKPATNTKYEATKQQHHHHHHLHILIKPETRCRGAKE